MPTCWFILLRFWLRVDGALMRVRDSRFFCPFTSMPAPVNPLSPPSALASPQPPTSSLPSLATAATTAAQTAAAHAAAAAGAAAAAVSHLHLTQQQQQEKEENRDRVRDGQERTSDEEEEEKHGVPLIVREYTEREDTFAALAAKGYPSDPAFYSDPFQVSDKLSIVCCQTEKLQMKKLLVLN
ncbi:unnamed protein product [Closterium sp. NIES-54]